jgi:hypothetical protein
MIIGFFELTSIPFPSNLHLTRSIPKIHSIHLRSFDKLSLKFFVAAFNFEKEIDTFRHQLTHEKL